MRKIKLKIPVIGNPRAGKTAFIQNLADEGFIDMYNATDGYHMTPLTMVNNHNTY